MAPGADARDGERLAIGRGQLLQHLRVARRVQVIHHVERGERVGARDDRLGHAIPIAIVADMDGGGLSVERRGALEETVLEIKPVEDLVGLARQRRGDEGVGRVAMAS